MSPLHPLKCLKEGPVAPVLGGCRTSTLHCIDHNILSRYRGCRSYSVASRATLRHKVYKRVSYPPYPPPPPKKKKENFSVKFCRPLLDQNLALTAIDIRECQQTREGCGCFRGLFGGSQGNSGKVPGKLRILGRRSGWLWADFPGPRGWRVTTALGNPSVEKSALRMKTL